MKRKISEVFGYEARDKWWYRDLALGLVGALTFSASLDLFFSDFSAFDVKMGIGSGLIFALCLALTPNRIFILMFALILEGVAAWYGAVAEGETRYFMVAIPVTLVAIPLIVKYWKRPLVTK
jgi:hypothetical protein